MVAFFSFFVGHWIVVGSISCDFYYKQDYTYLTVISFLRFTLEMSGSTVFDASLYTLKLKLFNNISS